MTITLNGTSGIVNDATSLSYTGTLTGGTGVVNLGSGQVYKDASGNVGIGTSSPSNILHVEKATASNTFIQSTNSLNTAFYGVGGAGPAYCWSGGAYPLLFGTSGTERARIDSSGNLIVSGAGSGSLGRLTTRSDGGTPLAVANEAASGTLVAFMGNGSGNRGSITHNGSTVAYNTTSDYRLKEAITPMTGALAKVAALNPVTYKWKSNGSDSQGFIAHELAEVVPDCVVGKKDGVETYTDEDGVEQTRPQYQGIDTSFLVATLAAAIQELKAVVDAQATRITALEGTAA